MTLAGAITKNWLESRKRSPRKLTILIDMDDTLENLCEIWTDMINETFGTSVIAKDIRTWDVEKVFVGVSKEDIFAQLIKQELWERVRPLPGSVEAVKKMIDDGHDVYIVTASHPSSVGTKINTFLFKYFPFIDWNHIIIASNKQMIRGDVMIDDGPHNLIGGKYYRILKSAYHNTDYDARAHGMVRIDNWEDIYNEICRLARGGK